MILFYQVGIRADSAAMAELLKLISDNGYNIIRQFMDHIWMEDEIHYVEVKYFKQ